MAFLFKSKKHQDRSGPGRDGAPGVQGPPPSAGARLVRDEKSSLHRSTPTGSLNSLDNEGSLGSPDRPNHGRRQASTDNTPPQSVDSQPRNGPPTSSPNSSLYPWSQRRLTYTSSHPSPFPRYGAAVNSMSSKEGDIYVMGGLINSSTVKGDLWMIEAGSNMACYPLATTAEGPGPRVGHASLLVGNAFIVYGGDTKIDESDVLDETLYLLNTSTRQWSRALPAGTRPSGRYGHSLNILGSKIYIFGGQVEGYFMNDLAAFDLNQLQMPNNRWEMLVMNSDSGGPPVGQVPPARTNHSMITYNDKMYLFGGTNGYQWFNDVWCFDPTTNLWTSLDCIGYIPVPREGHAAALVDDVMYVFGGRTEEGSDLGDLAAFRISSRRWYTFQNMGPSPSPRSGHSMTTVGKQIVVVGGEPSSATGQVTDLAHVYCLDTSKIRYPTDAQAQSRGPQGARRPSASEPPGVGAARNMPPRDGSNGPPDPNRMKGPPPTIREGGAVNSPNGIRPINGPDMNGQIAANNGNNMKPPPRAAAASPPAGPPPPGQPPQPKINTANAARMRGPSVERDGAAASPKTQSPITQQKENDGPVTNGRRTPTQGQVSRSGSNANAPVNAAVEALKAKPTRPVRSQGSVDSSTEPTLKTVANRPASPPPPTRQNSNPLSRRSSGRNSQTVVLLKELDAARNRNAWYASELELARKAGYVQNSSLNSALEGRSTETFDDDDKPLIEALLFMRTEVAQLQASVDKQAVLASKQIAEVEKQRDNAIQEAVYAKAKLAAQGGSTSSTPQLDSEARDADLSSDRSDGNNRKLAAALSMQKDLQKHIDRLSSDLESEKRARQLAEETVTAAQKRMSELESFKQKNSGEVERLKAELHMSQREAREQSIACAEAVAATQLLGVEKDEFENKYNEVMDTSKEHNDAFDSLREAIAASANMKSILERKLQEEKLEREKVESKLSNLKAEHEARTAELVSFTQRMKDAEELAEQHANEANAHRQALLTGLGNISARDVGQSGSGDSERLAALQGQLTSANALVKKYQQEADAASDKLRSAEERIAGLEAYQEQASREGVSIRRQLQATLRDIQGLQAANSDLKQQLESQMLETNAMNVQHNTLKDILHERGISPTSAARARNMGSPRSNSPEQGRIRDLQQQLATALAAHETTKGEAEKSAAEADSAYREKLTQLENDYSSAVHYVKGTEKMLKQMKEQLSRYRVENQRLKTELEDLEERSSSAGAKIAPADWEGERQSLEQRIQVLQEEMKSSAVQLERQMQTVRQELMDARRDRDHAVKSNEDATRKLASTRKDLEELQQENELLEHRAQDAEQKVSLLLDQVESSVDNYRRQSRQMPIISSEPPSVAGPPNGAHHNRQESSEAGSLYGSMGDARNSTALDNLATELETLRSHWEATNKNYRLSNTFDFDSSLVASAKGQDDGVSIGLSESLADWRKRLDTEEREGETKGKP